MKDLNRIFLMGRLGSDPEQIETKSGVTLVRFSLATQYRVRSDDGGDDSYRNETQWHRVITWGKVAENCSKYLKKGQSVILEGTVRHRKYIGKDKTFRMAFEIHAENVHFGGSKRSEKENEKETKAIVAESNDAFLNEEMEFAQEGLGGISAAG